MTAAPLIAVELFGVPRLRAGRAALRLRAATVGELLAELERACPGLVGLRHADGGLAPQYLLSLDGRCFVRDAEEPLQEGERVLLLSADAGG